MTTRTRVKTVPAANGRHRYLIVSGTLADHRQQIPLPHRRRRARAPVR